jgi:hypothetical protein
MDRPSKAIARFANEFLNVSGGIGQPYLSFTDFGNGRRRLWMCARADSNSAVSRIQLKAVMDDAIFGQ